MGKIIAFKFPHAAILDFMTYISCFYRLEAEDLLYNNCRHVGGGGGGGGCA